MSPGEISSERRKTEGKNSFELYLDQHGTSGLADTRTNPKDNSLHLGEREGRRSYFPLSFPPQG